MSYYGPRKRINPRDIRAHPLSSKRRTLYSDDTITSKNSHRAHRSKRRRSLSSYCRSEICCDIANQGTRSTSKLENSGHDELYQSPTESLNRPRALSKNSRYHGSWDSSQDDFDFPLNPDCYQSLFSPDLGVISWTIGHTPKSQRSSRKTTWLNKSILDRFVSNPSLEADQSRVFRLMRPVTELTKSEKLLRDPSASPDPFRPLVSSRVRDRPLNLSEGNGRPTQGNRNPARVLEFGNATAIIHGTSIARARQASIGAVWNVGGGSSSIPNGPVRAISDGRGAFTSSGSNAPLYTALFLEKSNTDEEVLNMGDRLAAALGIDRVSRIVTIPHDGGKRRGESTGRFGLKCNKAALENFKTQWVNGEWIKAGNSLLDAPLLRDDYYCTVLAYCETAKTLAVGLANRVYLWSEEFGVRYPPQAPDTHPNTYVTSLSFSSGEGGHCILAIGRNTGQLHLWSLYDEGDTRFKARHPAPISCVSFKPVVTRRPSEKFGSMTGTEELLAGDECGQIYYYCIEWMPRVQVDIHGWIGCMKLLAKIDLHTQQICGLSWSPAGDFFATGANDNACCLFEVAEILRTPSAQEGSSDRSRPLYDESGGQGGPASEAISSVHQGLMFSTNAEPSNSTTDVAVLEKACIKPGKSGSLLIAPGRQKHKWIHSAAVKAIAFCPWQRGLLATGGGSNDRAIHFYHTFSGACLATINVFAQVTSLVWSKTRREIAATFGYAQPEHPYRIAVFSWPECRQVVAVPWANDMRALSAIAYPKGPGETRSRVTMGETWHSRTAEEGCIVVACSDESVKFHEIWSGDSKSTQGHAGLLGGSSILEGLEGVEREGKELIR